MFSYTLIAGLVLTASGLFLFRRWQIWVLYFLTGGVGTALIAVYLFHSSPAEGFYRQFLTAITWLISGQPVWLKVFPASGMFLFRLDPNWVAFQLDIECLGFIEIIVFLSLLLYYRPFNWRTKLKFALLGSTLIYVINLLRVLLIIFLVKYFGLNLTFLSHTVFGRLLFFILVMGVYWHFFTAETVRQFDELGETEWENS